jgi:inorganic triphosphatase YgiF
MPIFVVEVERRSWRVEEDGALAEVSVDCGEITSGERRQPIAEAEIELKAGSPKFLFDLARKAIHCCDAPPCFVGKALRGRRLEHGEAESPQSALDLELKPGATAMTAFQQIVDACLLQASLNEELLRRHPGDVEADHYLRVAIRRLRAALALFAPMIAGAPCRALKTGLVWLSRLLGEVRDLDVLKTETIERARNSHPGVFGLDRLRDRCGELRQAAQRNLEEALRSERFRGLLLDVLEFAHAGAWMSEEDRGKSKLRGMSVATFAAKRLQRRLDAVTAKKSRDCIVGADEKDRHRLRIKAKKLRYMAEFFQFLAPTKRYCATAEALHDLQKALGDVHDGVAAEQFVSKLLISDNDVDLTVAAGLLKLNPTAEADSLAVACVAHRKLRRAKPFWQAFGRLRVASEAAR